MNAIRLVNHQTATDCRPSSDESRYFGLFEAHIYEIGSDHSVILVGSLDNLERLGLAIAGAAAWRREYERTGKI